MPYVLQTDMSVQCPMYSRQIWVLKAYVLQEDMSVKCPMYDGSSFLLFSKLSLYAICWIVLLLSLLLGKARVWRGSMVTRSQWLQTIPTTQSNRWKQWIRRLLSHQKVMPQYLNRWKWEEFLMLLNLKQIHLAPFYFSSYLKSKNSSVVYVYLQS